MKRLLAAGLDRIFQICKCHRRGERGDRHLPEFTLLEWYGTNQDYTRLMDDCEALLRFVASALGRGAVLAYGPHAIALDGPWERLTIQDAFSRYAPCSLETAIATGRFEEILTTSVEPRLGTDRPTFLYDYPAAMASLARLRPDNPAVAERFELYLAGMELANAFSELTDPGEQRRRFAAEEAARRRAGKPPYPSPDSFLDDLVHLPPAAGIALGLDRLVMVFADTRTIDEVVAFTPEML